MKKRLMGILLTLCMVLTLLPTTVLASGWASDSALHNGWYYLRAMNNHLNITADGAAELRKLSGNEAFYVESNGRGGFTLKMKDGRYLGLIIPKRRCASKSGKQPLHLACTLGGH